MPGSARGVDGGSVVRGDPPDADVPLPQDAGPACVRREREDAVQATRLRVDAVAGLAQELAGVLGARRRVNAWLVARGAPRRRLARREEAAALRARQPRPGAALAVGGRSRWLPRRRDGERARARVRVLDLQRPAARAPAQRARRVRGVRLAEIEHASDAVPARAEDPIITTAAPNPPASAPPRKPPRMDSSPYCARPTGALIPGTVVPRTIRYRAGSVRSIAARYAVR